MTEIVLRKLHPSETIMEFLPAIIEAFVTFYGESERENITTKFNNMLVVGYTKPEYINHIISQSKNLQSDELINELLSKLTKDEEKMKKIKKFLLDDTGLQYPNLHPIYYYIKYLEDRDQTNYVKQQVVKFLQQVYPETTLENLDELIEQKIFESLDSLISLYEEMITKYQEKSKVWQPYIDYVEECQKLKSGLNIRQDDVAYDQKMNTYYTSLPEYKKNRANIEALELLDKNDQYDASAYEHELTTIATDIRLVNGQYISYPLFLITRPGIEEYQDTNIIHELNHIYELHLQNVDNMNNTYEMTCGWDITKDQINNQRPTYVSLEKEEEQRDYQLFNEIINELISQEISEILSQMEIYIFNTKENKKIKGGTSYERTMFLVRDFYQLYKKEIIESRKHGNIQILFDTVGKENFDALNNLFHEYYENFSGYIIYQVYQDIKDGKETEKTQKYKELLFRSKDILSKMQEHSQKRNNSL